MKIIQSFWSKPSIKKNDLNYSDRNKGGWIEKKYNYMSWALSCLQFSKYYETVELVTDSLGYDLLIRKMELPYTKVTTCLDDLDDYHHDLWALGKIKAYSIQDQPFIHADGDIFIYERLGEDLESASLAAQNIERGFSYYNDIFENVQQTFTYVPEVLAHSRSVNDAIIAVNAGLIGGTDPDFFKEYATLAFRFIDENLHCLDKVNIGMFNPVFEQFLFYALAEHKGIPVHFYASGINHAFDGLSEFTTLPQKNKFVHTVGAYKKDKFTSDMLAFRLQTDHPHYYYKILNLLRTHQI